MTTYDYLAAPAKRVFDASCIKSAMFCYRAYYWRWIRGLVSSSSKSVHLQAGSAIHTGAEHLKRGKDLKTSTQLMLNETKDMEVHAIKTPLKLVEVLADLERFMLADKHTHTIEYFDENSQPQLALEVSFSLEMPNDTIFAGRIDRVMTQSKMTWIEDYKTTSRWSEYWYKDWENNFSLLGYCYALRRIIGVCHGAQITQMYINKSKTRTEREVVIDFSPKRAEVWEATYLSWTEELLRRTKLLETSSLDEAFPMCNCDFTCKHKYGSCIYAPICIHGDSAIESRGLVEEKPERKEDD